MSRPRLLDLFCGAGGAAVGYHRAGFDVVGVDHVAQPNYPFRFYQADALAVLRFALEDDGLIFGEQFDAIHASPPCQAFTQMSARWRGKGTKADTHPDLLTPTRELLSSLDIPWVIENVVGARNHMAATLTLHGGMFGLGVHRPRLFESNVLLLAPKSSQTEQPIGVYGTKPDGRTTYRYRNNGNYKGKSLIRAAKSIDEAREVMGIDWMTWDEIREAIPPAYCELIGLQLLQHLRVAGRTRAGSSPEHTYGNDASPGRRRDCLPSRGDPSGSESSASSHPEAYSESEANSPRLGRILDVQD